MSAPVGCLPIETWQNILLFAIEPDVGPSVFATTCSASTFIHFISPKTDSYIEYARRRATLRQVCCAWNQILLSSDSWWIYIPPPNRSTLVSPSIDDQVHAVKRLSMTFPDPDREFVELSVNWASHLLQRVPAPLITYDVDFPLCTISIKHCQIYHEVHDFLPGVGSKMALRSLRVQFPDLNRCRAITFPHLNANFKNLVSLSLCNLAMLSTEELTLPHLEFLQLTRYREPPPSPTQGWNLPRLRHVCVAGILKRPHINTWLKFLLRYASQLETLFLIMLYSWNDFPHDFWDSFTALQLLGLHETVLNDRGWGGWTTTPPPTHPLRYLVCRHCDDVVVAVDSLESLWTYHGEVGLVLEDREYYLIEDTKEKGWRSRMRRSDGILPDKKQSLE